MSLNATPSSERVHIGIFGKRNAGKSSLINAITGQNLAIVSEAKGTTTDPVYKAMELLPLGPVMIIDTPGIDDEGVLGSLRIQKAYQVLNKTDIALVIIDAAVGPSAEDLRFIKRINAKKNPPAPMPRLPGNEAKTGADPRGPLPGGRDLPGFPRKETRARRLPLPQSGLSETGAQGQSPGAGLCPSHPRPGL